MSSDKLFHEMTDTWIITRARGVYRQSKVYRRGSFVYASKGSGFVRLFSSGGTSDPNTSWVEFEPATAIKDYLLDLGLGPGVSIEDRTPRPGSPEPPREDIRRSYPLGRRGPWGDPAV